MVCRATLILRRKERQNGGLILKKLPVFPVMRGNVFESKSAYKKLLNIAYDYQQVYIKECTTWEESRVTMENFTQKLIVHF